MVGRESCLSGDVPVEYLWCSRAVLRRLRGHRGARLLTEGISPEKSSSDAEQTNGQQADCFHQSNSDPGKGGQGFLGGREKWGCIISFRASAHPRFCPWRLVGCGDSPNDPAPTERQQSTL